MKFLVTGGAGYVGSHFVYEAKRQGHTCVVYDNLERGHRELVPGDVELIIADVRDQATMTAAIKQHRPDVILHFAAYALVPESVREPKLYEDNNVGGMRSLIAAVAAAGARTPIIFSSTCGVFGTPKKVPIAEGDPKSPESPYGATKLECEKLLMTAATEQLLPSIALRYFNACGADASGEIGEWHEPETHLIPNILKAALAGNSVKIFGNDFPTRDGTCVRDYIHVTDLARGHLLAAKRLLAGDKRSTFEAIHLGTGKGLSNLEVLQACAAVLGEPIKHEIAARRPGDPAELYADASLATKLLGVRWEFSDIRTIVSSALKWERR